MEYMLKCSQGVRVRFILVQDIPPHKVVARASCSNSSDICSDKRPMPVRQDRLGEQGYLHVGVTHPCTACEIGGTTKR